MSRLNTTNISSVGSYAKSIPIEKDKKKETNMKTISEEYVIQLEQLHDQKASFGDAKGLKPIAKWIDEHNLQVYLTMVVVKVV